MTGLVVRANAKLNLTLDILGRRADGYHELMTVMQSVDLSDRITVKRAPVITARASSVFVPNNEKNLAYRAAVAFFEATGLRGGAFIDIQKRIPVSAGMAGGSADAAAVLTALNLLYHARLTTGQLMELGAPLGADVPFCLHGGTALCRGVGEKVTPLHALPPCHIVIARSGRKRSTAQVYAEFDQRGRVDAPASPAMAEALAQQQLALIGGRLANAFEPVVPQRQIEPLKKIMLECGALGTVMSGSGPSVFGMFSRLSRAQTCAARLRESCGAVFICRPVRHGCLVEKRRQIV